MSLREYITALDNAGELRRQTSAVSWRHEVGAIARAYRRPLLFESICDYPGARIFTNGLSSRSHIARAIGLPPGITRREFLRAVRERLRSPIKPTMCSEGPAQQNCIKGGALDLARLPVPWWSEYDGGRYIGTWHINVTRDPQTGISNAGTYRMQLLGPNRTTVSVSPNSHLAQHAAIAHSRNRPLEMAVAIGVSEAMVMAAGASFPFGTDEYEFAGALEGKAVGLVKCTSVDVYVPADAEYVLEGEIVPGERVVDGPYMDYAGIQSTNPGAFLFEVKRITHRDHPIFRGTSIGNPGAEDHILFGVLAQLGLVDFHGSQTRQRIQNALLRRGLYRLFQMTGRVGKMVHA